MLISYLFDEKTTSRRRYSIVAHSGLLATKTVTPRTEVEVKPHTINFTTCQICDTAANTGVIISLCLFSIRLENNTEAIIKRQRKFRLPSLKSAS